jgi:hypothetical protein
VHQIDSGIPPQSPSGEWAPGPAPRGQLPVEYRPPSDAVVLERLRRTYTRHDWGILHDGQGTWTGVRSPGPDIVKGNAFALRAAIEADPRERTQTFRPGGIPRPAGRRITRARTSRAGGLLRRKPT